MVSWRKFLPLASGSLQRPEGEPDRWLRSDCPWIAGRLPISIENRKSGGREEPDDRDLTGKGTKEQESVIHFAGEHSYCFWKRLVIQSGKRRRGSQPQRPCPT